MDKKRAAIVASAGVGLLVSAFVLHKWNLKRRSGDEESEPPEKQKEMRAVVHTDGHATNGRRRFRKRVADGV